MRSQKLMNSRDNNRKMIVLQFLCFAAIFIVYFIVNYVLEVQFVDTMLKTYNHLLIINERPSIVKYVVVFTFEHYAEKKGFKVGDVDMRLHYISQIYSNEKNVFTSLKETYPSTYSSYLKTFENYNYDLCSSYADFVGQKSRCE